MNDNWKKNHHLLIVDDAPKNIQVLGTVLKTNGYQIRVAYDGVEAIKMVEKFLPDLILLDIMMPKMDGFETCKKLKESKKSEPIPIIFLSAKTGTEDIVKGFELGAVDYITKPFNSVELLARVHTHLSLKNARDIIQKTNEELSEKNEQLINMNNELKQAFKEIKTLRGLLPICSNCKKIRLEGADPKARKSWVLLEAYISENTEAEFSHGLCPDCLKELYPKYFKEL